MSAAARFQIPNPTGLPQFHGFGYAGVCQSALRNGGGDYYDVVPLDEHSFLMVVADVMGKGEAAALFASSMRTLVRAVAWPGSDPADCLAEVNELMFEQLSGADTFITAQLAVANLQHRELVVANAGHCPLLLSDGRHVAHAIAPEGIPLGIQRDAKFHSQCVLLQPHTTALMYTDGVTEARNAAGKFFGQARLERWFRRSLANGQNAAELKADLAQTLAAFQGGDQVADDQTFLLLSDETPRPVLAPRRTSLKWYIPWRQSKEAGLPITVVS
jgi:serine phosphatase RsbU (regulator of sigma subunit)